MNRATLPLVLGALLLVLFPLCLLAGQVWINPFDPAGANATVILAQLRLPRAVLAVVVGAGLGRRARRCRAICAIRWPIPACSAWRPWPRWARCSRCLPAMRCSLSRCRRWRWPGRRGAWSCSR
jgi:hypothetical protein